MWRANRLCFQKKRLLYERFSAILHEIVIQKVETQKTYPLGKIYYTRQENEKNSQTR